MKKVFLRGMLFLFLAGMLSGCGARKKMTQDPFMKVEESYDKYKSNNPD